MYINQYIEVELRSPRQVKLHRQTRPELNCVKGALTRFPRRY